MFCHAVYTVFGFLDVWGHLPVNFFLKDDLGWSPSQVTHDVSNCTHNQEGCIVCNVLPLQIAWRYCSSQARVLRLDMPL